MARKRKHVDHEKRHKLSPVLIQLRDAVTAGYVAELKMPAETARAAADMAIEMMRESSAGSAVYIAKGHLWAITENHRRIYKRYQEQQIKDYGQLAREFDRTERQIYTIVDRCMQEKFERDQFRLPGT